MRTSTRNTGVFAVLLVAISLPCAAQQQDWRASLDEARRLDNEGRYQESMEKFEAVMKIAEASNPNQLRIGFTLNFMGSLLRHLGQNALAEQKYRQAVRLLEQAGDTRTETLAAVLGNLGDTLLELNQYGQAERVYRRAYGILQEVVAPGRCDPLGHP